MAEYVCEVVTEHELCGDVHHYVRRERVVRRRDCGRALDGATCGIWCMEHNRQTEPDGFCAWGRSVGVDD